MFELVCSLYFLHSLTLFHLEIHKEKTCPHLLVSYICLTKMHTVEARSKRLGSTTHMHLFSFLCFALLCCPLVVGSGSSSFCVRFRWYDMYGNTIKNKIWKNMYSGVGTNYAKETFCSCSWFKFEIQLTYRVSFVQFPLLRGWGPTMCGVRCEIVSTPLLFSFIVFTLSCRLFVCFFIVSLRHCY